ncbi:MAG: hypothetical protein V4636_13110 [Pseudomonadota bacterium]
MMDVALWVVIAVLSVFTFVAMMLLVQADRRAEDLQRKLDLSNTMASLRRQWKD